MNQNTTIIVVDKVAVGQGFPIIIITPVIHINSSATIAV
jgi:hypothetical protein